MGSKVADLDPEEEMMKAFGHFMEQGQDKINVKNLKKIAKELGETMNDDEL